ncbi:hypothetical protein GJ744_005366 [Endocarpon pusillum]|uniref:Uncharacterized protein n=1 Tax=Endocarpon pusillum TaxID=364733 RepID=A0A8H7E7E2_9EURO|nr:hypothetical protein GJ744_005366 [Endocarpon pusillum]
MSTTINEIQNAPQTFSSWDSCMQKAYCKWPAIIGIIVAVTIAVSVLWCCVRCCCGGLSCCCGCFSCFNRCCTSGRGRGRKRSNKYADMDADAPLPSSYRLPANPNPYTGYTPNYGPPAYNGPNTATFDVPVGQKINGDSLPAMPTWADAKVENSIPRRGGGGGGDDVEMGYIAQPGQATGVIPVAAAGGRTSRGGYRELPHHDDSSLDQPRSYRGANSTHPYASDLGAQALMPQNNTAYDPPPPPPQPQFDHFHAGSTSFPRSSPFAPTYNAYAAADVGGSGSSGQARPPSLLQVGRKPM